MQRHRVVYPGLDAVLSQSLAHPVPVFDHHHVQVMHGHDRFPELRDRHTGPSPQGGIVVTGGRAPSLVPGGQARQLDQQQGRLQVVQAVAVAGHPVRVLVLLPVVAVQAHRRSGGGVVGGDGAAVAQRPEVLARVEAERGRVAQRSGRPALVGGAVRLTRVFYDCQAVSRGDLGERVHVHGLPIQVHGHDRGGTRRDRGPDGGGVHETITLEAVHEDRRGADVAHGLGSRDERVGRDDDLVAGLDPRGEQRELDRVGPRAHPHRMAAAAERGEGLFELLELGTHGVGGP